MLHKGYDKPSVSFALLTDFSLMVTGNYHDHIVAVLTGAGKSTDDAHVRNSIFNCLSGGEIAYQGYCTYGCGGTQSEDPDYCLPQY